MRSIAAFLLSTIVSISPAPIASSLLQAENNQEQFLTEIIESTQQLNEISPTWQPRTVATYDDGSMRRLIYLDEDNNIVKRLEYYPSGNILLEEDGTGKDEFIRNGASFSFYEDGVVQQSLLYNNGKKEGLLQRFHPNGERAFIATFVNGELEGCAQFFSETGTAEERLNYSRGQPHGDVISFFPTGLQKRKAHYTHGLLNGVVEERYPNGAIKAKKYYAVGRLDKKKSKYFNQEGVQQKPPQKFVSDVAYEGEYVEYAEDGTLLKQLFYKNGSLDGEQKLFHRNGKPYVVANFKNGLRNGSYTEWDDKGIKRLAYIFKNDIQEGLSESFFENGKTEESSTYKAGIPEGRVVRFSPEGILLFEATWKDGVQEGPCIERYPNNTIALRCSYLEGLLDGQEERYYEDGSPQSTKQFRKGVPVGTHIDYYPKECKQKIKTRIFFNEQGMLEGDAIRYFPSGAIQATSTYKNGLLHGKKKFFAEDGTPLFDACYENGNLTGSFFQKKASGIEVSATYKNNRLSGPYKEFYVRLDGNQNGKHAGSKIKAMETTFSDGKIDGTLVSYNEEGKKTLEITFSNGKREGKALMYGDNGNLLCEAEFHNGKQNGPMTEFFPNGKVFRKRLFKDDLEDGPEVVFYDNGQLAKECLYKDGKLHGLIREWTADNVLIFEAEFKNGLRHGKFNKYNEDGTPRVLQIFVDDVLESRSAPAHEK